MPQNSNHSLPENIRTALQAFKSASLHDASISLLKTLGYQSDKTIEIPKSDPDEFLKILANQRSDIEINKEKALFDDWLKADILFQLTDEELSNQVSLFENDTVNVGLLQSYLFFAIELKEQDYARGKLTAIARQLNRVFPMPVMVFIKHGDHLSIAVINRRINKRDAEKDVLGKVTIIRDISLASPHRGHLDILSSFALPSLTTKIAITSFDMLHAAWEEIFNVELLNKRFYKELANWYFWALQHVHFPFDSVEAKRDFLSGEDKIREHDAKNVIRLLTRLLFVWFIKEKGLIPTSLFDEKALSSDILKNLDIESNNTVFYKAILQNLFFATLNQTRGERQFRKSGQNRNITTLMRYEDYFRNPETFVKEVEETVPFLNGGLFECLDKPHPTKKGPQGGDVIIYEDGFSDHKDNELFVPDYLFFGAEKTVDLSKAYGDKKRKNEKVRGIIHILNSYKFTIVENTPIDQEIALDPELLGKVFENLLASYNPETKTTARKQTGSFYTPRTIVDYMVDESLKAYLERALCAACPNVSLDEAKEGLDILFSYTEKEHVFSRDEKLALIKAIDDCKIIDPACGSGAFPMGILHKLEFILGKLDKDNALWRDRQIEKVENTISTAEDIEDATIRENTIQELEAQKKDIAEAFDNNDLAYGRKLFLIENCIYGIDIQSIATQVSKLRFFISLIVDQRTNPEKDNFGIRPLPNLETKFTSADTLIQIYKSGDQGELIESGEVDTLKKELKRIRHHMFSAKTPKTKKKYRQLDEELRKKISAELKKIGWDSESAKLFSQWDPYDQNASAPFFDAEWMYGVSEGFDIVIGNPPYIQIQKFPKANKDQWISQKYKTYAARGDIYCLFYERGFDFLKQNGVLCYITSNKWMRAGYGLAMRKYFLQTGGLKQLIDFGDSPIFSAATTYTNILLWEKRDAEDNRHTKLLAHDLNNVYEGDTSLDNMLDAAGERTPMFDEKAFVLANPIQDFIRSKIEEIGTPLKQWNIAINYGVKTGCNEAFIIDSAKKEELISADPKSAEIIKPILRGRDIKRYKADYADLWMILAKYGSNEYLKDNYQAVYHHLRSHELKLKNRGQCKSGGKGNNGQHHWLELDNNPTDIYLDTFEGEKIIYAEIVYDSAFYYDDSKMYAEATAFILSGEKVKYLTALLNSRLLTYAFKAFYAGGDLRGNTFRYKKVFLELLPVPRVDIKKQKIFESFVDFMQIAKMNADVAFVAVAQFIEDLIDACVFELYFREHMADRNLLLLDDTEALLDKYNPEEPDEKKLEFLKHFYKTANAPDHPIRNRLLRMSADSPDLLAVIKEEGQV